MVRVRSSYVSWPPVIVEIGDKATSKNAWGPRALGESEVSGPPGGGAAEMFGPMELHGFFLSLWEG